MILFISISFAEILNVPSANYPTIQAAIDSALVGDTVMVDEGTYYENINFKGKAITVSSPFYVDGDSSHIENTIINGSQHEDPDSGSVVYFVSGEDTNSVLCGFTITGGTGTKAYFYDDLCWYGGGVFCQSGGKIINNIIKENAIDVDVVLAGGGGILAGWLSTEYVYIQGNKILSNSVRNSWADGGGISIFCSGKIIDNVIISNSVTSDGSWACGGGIECYGNNTYSTSVDIIDNQIENNQVHATGFGDIRGHAGGLRYIETNGNINNNTFMNNSIESSNEATGGAIFINACKTVSVFNNLILANKINSTFRGTGGGLSYHGQSVSGYAEIYNNIIIDNETGIAGGGMELDGTGNDEAVVMNNTILGNESSMSGGGVYVASGIEVNIFNSIVWGNQAVNDDQIYSEAGSSLQILYSDIQGGWTGKGNINSDPLFLDTQCNLCDTSFCVGNGIDSVEISGVWYTCPNIDYNGDPRPNPIDSHVDMGAIESPYRRAVIDGIAEMINDVPIIFELSQNYPNPFNPVTMVNYQLPMISHVELAIYNLLGQKVATLVNNQQQAGTYQVEWNATGLASGVYYYRLEAGNFAQTRKMIYLK